MGKKRFQRFLLDNKQSYYFVAAFIIMTVILGILLLSAAGMNSQYDREATKIKAQGNALRELLKTEMMQKQATQKQLEDVLDTIKRVDENISFQNDLVTNKNIQLEALIKAVDEAESKPKAAPLPVPAPPPIFIPPVIANEVPVPAPPCTCTCTSTSTSTTSNNSATRTKINY